MGFIHATRTCFRKCVTFSGRASRSEFWWVAFFLMLVNLILTASQMAFLGPSETHRSVIHTGLGAAFTTQVTRPAGPGGLLYFWISMLLLLALVLPCWAVVWRRMHDTSRSGWRILLAFAIIVAGVFLISAVIAGPSMIWHQLRTAGQFNLTVSSPVPVLIFIALILQFILWPVVMLTQQSTPGANKYGPNPSEVTS